MTGVLIVPPQPKLTNPPHLQYGLKANNHIVYMDYALIGLVVVMVFSPSNHILCTAFIKYNEIFKKMGCLITALSV